MLFSVTCIQQPVFYSLPAMLCWCALDSYWSWGWELFVCIDGNEPAFRWKSPKPGLGFGTLQEPFETSALGSFKAIWPAPYAQDVSSGIPSSSWWLKLPPLKMWYSDSQEVSFCGIENCMQKWSSRENLNAKFFKF